jgi:tetratricopeptide (TPR) repeat protein
LNCLRLLFFIILSTLSFAEFAHSADGEAALFAKSMELYQREDFAESAKLLTDLVRQNPQKALYWFNLGNCAYMTRNYENAAKYFRQTIRLKSVLAPAARLYLAKSLRQTGKYDEATQILNELAGMALSPGIAREAALDLNALQAQQDLEEGALASYQEADYAAAEDRLRRKPENDLSPSARLLLALSLAKQSKMNAAERVLKNLSAENGLAVGDRATVQDLLKKVRYQEFENKTYWASMDVSYGSSNNIYADGKSVAPVSSPLARAFLGIGYHFNAEKAWSVKAGYFLAYENPQDAPDLQTLTHTLQTPLLYQTANISSSLTPYLQLQSWASTNVSDKAGLAGKYTLTGETFEGGVDLDIASQSSMIDSVRYLSGPSSSLRPYAGWWGKAWYGQIYWLTGFEGMQDIVYADGARLPLTHNYQGPGAKVVWKPADSLVGVLNLSSLQRNYRNVSLPAGTARRDQEMDVSLRVSYALNPKIWIYTLAEFINNDSTLGASDVRDKNFNVTVVTLGLNWEAF